MLGFPPPAGVVRIIPSKTDLFSNGEHLLHEIIATGKSDTYSLKLAVVSFIIVAVVASWGKMTGRSAEKAEITEIKQ